MPRITIGINFVILFHLSRERKGLTVDPLAATFNDVTVGLEDITHYHVTVQGCLDAFIELREPFQRGSHLRILPTVRIANTYVQLAVFLCFTFIDAGTHGGLEGVVGDEDGGAVSRQVGGDGLGGAAESCVEEGVKLDEIRIREDSWFSGQGAEKKSNKWKQSNKAHCGEFVRVRMPDLEELT